MNFSKQINKNQLKLGVLFSYINIGTTIIISLLYTPYLLRMLGQSEYGLFSIAFSTIGVMSIMDFGLGNANIRYTAKYRAEHNKEKEQVLHGMFFLLYLIIGIVVLVLGLVIYRHVKSIFGQNMSFEEVLKLERMILFVVISVSLSFPLSVFGFIIIGYERFVFAKLVELLRILLIPLSAVLLLLTGYRSVGIISVIALLNILLLTLNLLYCIIYLKIRLRFTRFNKSLLREILSYSLFVFLGVLAFRMNSNSNQFILGIVSGTVPVAVYALAFNLVINFSVISGAISSVFLPVITRIPDGANQLNEYNGYFTAIGRLQFFVLGLFILGFIFFGRQFIALWVGANYVLSYWIVIILLSTFCLYLIQSVGISILQAQNKHKFSSRVFFTSSIFAVLLSFVLSKRFGAIGSAAALSIAWLVGYVIIMNIYYARNIKLNIKHFWSQIFRITPAFVPAIGFGLLFLHFYNADTWMKLFIGVLCFAIIYVVSVICFSFNKFEKEIIVAPVLRIARKLFVKL